MSSECERLQGLPDNWTLLGEWTDSSGKIHKEADSPRYKAIGNSLAVPYWFYLLRRISALYERPATLGSLFDGIGGFPYAWEKCNGAGTALWASEIEEFCIAVTKKHFPNMKHFGDINKINVDDLPFVDCITGGSPCQDLSVAGKRAGLEGERSGLFMEQIRITKEMRKRARRDGRTDDPGRFFVWENVPGALSSPGKGRNGEDFRAVLTEIVRVAEPDAPDVPLPDRGGRWSKSGILMGKSWSIAYRITDAQYWGVPQRRKRISLVADLSGLTAPWVVFGNELRRKTNRTESDKAFGNIGERGCRSEVLPIREGLSRNSESCCEEREGTSRGSEDSTGESDEQG